MWAVTGLLHDADYEQWPEEHPRRIVDWLRQQGEEEMAYAVSFHQTKWELPPKTTMDKALLACDELAGFVVACCLVRPEGVATLTPKSVKKKLKDKAFAAKVDRAIIQQGVELAGRRSGRTHSVPDRRPEAPCGRVGDRGKGAVKGRDREQGRQADSRSRQAATAEGVAVAVLAPRPVNLDGANPQSPARSSGIGPLGPALTLEA